MNNIRAIVVGALGRMGQNVKAALERKGWECAASVDINYYGTGGGFSHISEVTSDADVIIDFSFHGATEDVVKYAAEKKLPVIVATTGHSAEEREKIFDAANKTAVFYSGNMSLGIATLADVVKRVLSVFDGADVEIVECHHNRKLDAPSGTALMLFDAVKEVRPEATAICGRSGNRRREKNEVGISSVRAGGIVGIHEVIITTESEQLTLRHEAFDRALFADGAIKACEFLVGKKAGLYTMKDVLKG